MTLTLESPNSTSATRETMSSLSRASPHPGSRVLSGVPHDGSGATR